MSDKPTEKTPPQKPVAKEKDPPLTPPDPLKGYFTKEEVKKPTTRKLE